MSVLPGREGEHITQTVHFVRKLPWSDCFLGNSAFIALLQCSFFSAFLEWIFSLYGIWQKSVCMEIGIAKRWYRRKTRQQRQPPLSYSEFRIHMRPWKTVSTRFNQKNVFIATVNLFLLHSLSLLSFALVNSRDKKVGAQESCIIIPPPSHLAILSNWGLNYSFGVRFSSNLSPIKCPNMENVSLFIRPQIL